MKSWRGGRRWSRDRRSHCSVSLFSSSLSLFLAVFYLSVLHCLFSHLLFSSSPVHDFRHQSYFFASNQDPRIVSRGSNFLCLWKEKERSPFLHFFNWKIKRDHSPEAAAEISGKKSGERDAKERERETVMKCSIKSGFLEKRREVQLRINRYFVLCRSGDNSDCSFGRYGFWLDYFRWFLRWLMIFDGTETKKFNDLGNFCFSRQHP